MITVSAWQKKLGLVDYVFKPDEAMDGIMKVTNGNGVERAIDASASDPGRQLAIQCHKGNGAKSHRRRRRHLPPL